jgi:hypothetical protein
MSKKGEPVLVTRQKIVVLLRAKPTMVENVHVVIKVRCSEPIFN